MLGNLLNGGQKTFIRIGLWSMAVISMVALWQFLDYRKELSDANLRKDLFEHGAIAKSQNSEYHSTKGGCEIKFVIAQPGGSLYHNSYRPDLIECLDFEEYFRAGHTALDIAYDPAKLYRAMPMLNGGIRQRDTRNSFNNRIRNSSIVLGIAFPLVFLMFWQYRRRELRQK
jgi:hypothetical protein